MNQPLKEMLKKIGGSHLLNEDVKLVDYQNELGEYIKQLRPNVKGWKFGIDRQTGGWYWEHPKYESQIFATWGGDGKEQVQYEVDGDKFGKADKYKAKFDMKKDSKWYIANAKKSIPQVLKTAQDGNF